MSSTCISQCRIYNFGSTRKKQKICFRLVRFVCSARFLPESLPTQNKYLKVQAKKSCGGAGMLRTGAVLSQKEFPLKLTPQSDNSDLGSFNEPFQSVAPAKNIPASYLRGCNQGSGRNAQQVLVTPSKRMGCPGVGIGPSSKWIFPYISILRTCLVLPGPLIFCSNPPVPYLNKG